MIIVGRSLDRPVTTIYAWLSDRQPISLGTLVSMDSSFTEDSYDCSHGDDKIILTLTTSPLTIWLQITIVLVPKETLHPAQYSRH